MSTDPTPIPAYGGHRRRHDPEGSTWPYCAADDAPWPCETVSAFAAGLAAGRTAAAADIRTEVAANPNLQVWEADTADVVEYCASLAEGAAARVAEHGPQSRADR